MRPANDFLRKPPGPMKGIWSWRYLDIWKTLKMVRSERVKSFYAKFPSVFPPGEEFPDFELKDIQGNVHRMSDYRGKKYVVLTAGAIT
ncbi:MAG: hypothetical protein V3V62_07115 [bacterium]